MAYIIMFSGFYLDREVAVPAKCLSPIPAPIIYFEARVRKQNDFTMPVGSSNNILIAMLRENSFIHAGPLRQKLVGGVYCL